eukprot:scaffold20255_cov34-Tisochrysis_lutea.AAC.1
MPWSCQVHTTQFASPLGGDELDQLWRDQLDMLLTLPHPFRAHWKRGDVGRSRPLTKSSSASWTLYGFASLRRWNPKIAKIKAIGTRCC